MTITHMNVATVYVSDQDKALEFYVDRLGFEKLRDDAFGEGLRWAQVGPRGAQTSIVLAKDDGGQPAGGFTGMTFWSDDVQATYEELSVRGVPFSERPTPQPWGMMQAMFEDQDGNAFVLVGPLPVEGA